ncbi:hypothetical protein E5D57_004713 [Metarhizium anisopliae]|nr:hypothetical protein E5D57_004713 [Metarhizium anisopliae]
MEWFMKKGDDIQRDQKIKFTFYRTLEKGYKKSDLIFRDELEECQDSYEFNYDLVVSLESAIMTFSLEVDGKTMGSVNVDYK